ncbi:hypothetical protein [Streptococcus oricebi]|nr:hypothetical protein [Streptococcus oricebi]
MKKRLILQKDQPKQSQAIKDQVAKSQLLYQMSQYYFWLQFEH